MKKNKTVQNNSNDNQAQYGLFSLVAVVIGIVIGSGIFIKNSLLFSSNHSVILSIISWFIGGLIVLSMIIAFLEVFSITKITNEQSTLGNWSRHLIGPKTGKTIGYYYTFVYQPLSILVISMFGAGEFIKVFPELNNVLGKGFGNSFIYIGLTLMIGAFLFLLNTFFTKPGIIFQNIGTSVKMIPLLFVIVLMVIMMIWPHHDLNPIFSHKYNKGITDYSSGASMNLIFISIPPVLFSFDGFLSAGSLSKETRKKSTFKWSIIVGMLIVASTYIIFSVSTFALGDVNAKDYGSIQNTIINQFPVQSSWLSPITTLIVTFSIITGVSGTIITTSALMTDLSATNSIKDSENKYLKRNKNLSTPKSSIAIMNITLVWFIIISVLNLMFIGLASDFNDTGYIPISDFASNILTIGAFISYEIIIIAALVNRFTKKVKTEKTKGFIISSFFSIISMGMAVLTFTYNVFVPPSGGSHSQFIAYILDLVFTVIFVGISIMITIYHFKKAVPLSKEEHSKKEKAKKSYYMKQSN